MATLTIRRLDPAIKERLRVRAAQRGHSMEEEARRILSESCGPASRAENLADIALRLFGEDNGIELELPARETGREPRRWTSPPPAMKRSTNLSTRAW
jgi:antitoxin FitA